MNALELQNFITTPILLIIQLYADSYREIDQKETLAELAGDLSLPRIQNYDYIIVGAGSAGCLLAERLSRANSVLLLEVGGPPPPAVYSHFPVYQYVYSPVINFVFTTAPQAQLTGTNNRMTLTSGKMLGGSGSHNENVYNRGSPYDYDAFAEFIQDPSFKYQNMVKYFKRVENFRAWLLNESDWNGLGHSGNFLIEKSTDAFTPLWFRAGQEEGFEVADPNPTQRVSFAPQDRAEYNTIRVSSYSAFIRPIDGVRRTLRVLKYSFVEQVLIKNGKAYGVLYKRHGIPQIAHANKEVILSTGTIATPMLLIKSGIGPSEVLRQAGIPLVKELPAVGKNFRDRAGVQLNFKINNPGPYRKYFPSTTEELERELEEFQKPIPSGYFTKPMMGQAFLVSSKAKSAGEGDYPDLELVFQHNNIDEESPEVAMSVILSRPKFIGEVRFNTTAYLEGETDDEKLAIIDPNYLSDESDIAVLTEGIRFAIKVLTKTQTFSSFNMSLELPVGCTDFVMDTDEYWSCFIKDNLLTLWQFASTARMGKDSDATSVLYGNFSVKGIQNLRVVDASALPKTTNINLNAAVLVMAEKAADVILNAA